MRLISVATQDKPGEPSARRWILTFEPMPDANPTDFVRQLRGCTALGPSLMAIDRQGARVVVTLINLALTKVALERTRELPRFTYLLPDEN